MIFFPAIIRFQTQPIFFFFVTVDGAVLYGSVAENAKIVFKALMERKLSMSTERTSTSPKCDDDEDEFDSILFKDDE